MNVDEAVAAFLKARRARKLHIRGPLVGGLWMAHMPAYRTHSATATSLEGAYRAWFTYWGNRP